MMGWLTGVPVPQGSSIRRELDRILTFEADGVRQVVLKSALVAFGEYYAAVERIDHKGVRSVHAAVFLVEIGKGRDRGTFGYKDLDETVGPYAARCPAPILDLLTDPKNELADEWRRRCRQAKRDQAEIRALRPGQWIRLGSPLNCNGHERDLFRVMTRGWRQRHCFASGGRLYAISDATLASVGFSVIDAPSSDQGVAVDASASAGEPV